VKTFAAAVLVFVGSFAAAAQVKTPAPAGPLTTSSGVYTAQQAMRGEQTYMAFCVNCHPVGTYASPAFQQKWNNQPLSQLFDWVTNMMPKNDPGSLDPEEYVQVIAYMLRINGAPAGKAPLPAAAAPLKKIKIEMPAKRR
jgi:cytochrome c5